MLKSLFKASFTFYHHLCQSRNRKKVFFPKKKIEKPHVSTTLNGVSVKTDFMDRLRCNSYFLFLVKSYGLKSIFFQILKMILKKRSCE